MCKLRSEHEDVLAFDAEEYPAGTEKIAPFLALDVDQERRGKVLTSYKSYAQIQICSPINRGQRWDDSVNVPWEAFSDFFAIFGLRWDPITFLKRGRFHREEALLVNEYLSRCFYLDHGNLQELALDLGRLDFARIQYDEIFMRLPRHELLPSEAEAPTALREPQS